MSVVVEIGKSAGSAWNWDAITAIVTGVTALIALFVGVLPVLSASRRRKRQAKVLAQVLADELTIQEVYLRAAIEVPRGESGQVSAWEYQEVSKATSFLNPQPVMDLISFAPNLPKHVVSAAAQCAAMLSIGRQRRVFLVDAVPEQRYAIAGDVDWYMSIARDIHKLRVALHAWIGTTPQEFATEVSTLTHNLRAVASAAQRRWSVERMRDAAEAARRAE